jgi:hypothetical protein
MQFQISFAFWFSRRFLKINKSGCDLIGFSEENILYHNFDEFVHPDDKEIFNDQVTDLEKRKVHSNLKIAMLRVMVILWLSWYCNSTLKEGLIYATAKNITEKKIKRIESWGKKSCENWKLSDLVNESVFWSDEVHQLHDTDVKSFIPALEGAMNFIGQIFANW